MWILSRTLLHVILCAGLVLLTGAGCALQTARAELPPGCSGVPGDFATPGGTVTDDVPTLGPRGVGRPVALTARARPPGGDTIPLLHVFGPAAEPVVRGHAMAALLGAPVFLQAEREAYWGEIVDGAFHRVPVLDKCSIAVMLDATTDFRAPPQGLLFVQFIVPDCDECTRITRAIQTVIDANPQLAVRWLQVTVPGSVGKLAR